MIARVNNFDKGMLREQAIQTALLDDVSTEPDCAVFFSGNKNNMRDAMNFCRDRKEHGVMSMLHTPAYKDLKEMHLFGKNSPFTHDEAIDISALVSARFAQEASGNVTVFVGELEGKSRSTFFTIELPALLLNDNVETINGFNKMQWLQYVQPPVLPRTDIIPPETVRFDVSGLQKPDDGTFLGPHMNYPDDLSI